MVLYMLIGISELSSQGICFMVTGPWYIIPTIEDPETMYMFEDCRCTRTCVFVSVVFYNLYFCYLSNHNSTL